MSKEFSSDCKHSQTQAVLHFSPICLCERCKWPHASCLPRDKLCQHISTIFQSFSAFSALSISHSNSNHLISLPLPPSPSFFQAFKLYLSPLYQWFSSNSHYIFCDQTAQSSFLLTGNVSQTQEKCWCPFRAADGDWGTQKVIWNRSYLKWHKRGDFNRRQNNLG